MEVVASTTPSYTALVENVLKKEKRKRAKFISSTNRIKAEEIINDDVAMPAIRHSMYSIHEDLEDEETVRPRLLEEGKPVVASEMGDSTMLNQIDRNFPVESQKLLRFDSSKMATVSPRLIVGSVEHSRNNNGAELTEAAFKTSTAGFANNRSKGDLDLNFR